MRMPPIKRYHEELFCSHKTVSPAYEVPRPPEGMAYRVAEVTVRVYGDVEVPEDAEVHWQFCNEKVPIGPLHAFDVFVHETCTDYVYRYAQYPTLIPSGTTGKLVVTGLDVETFVRLIARCAVETP
jgi:hypothetical protein